MRVIFWAFVLWQLWRIFKKVLGFSKKNWEETLAPTFVLVALLVFVAALGFALLLFTGFLFLFI